ncbi:hypothetical protein PoB_000642400 [Plakobranchus ocellatus]|uniref:Uncharacterized protein n=1 Tax=Plakobranchus ocellatus TaxID=259542 RepID=A0AAV3YAC9_9GAST|nr:hypothetical protein PoB_000642400 [Plakobranchus ocellatus]
MFHIVLLISNFIAWLCVKAVFHDTIPCSKVPIYLQVWGVGATADSESALGSARTLLSQVRDPPLAPWPKARPEGMRPPCCGLPVYKNQTKSKIQLLSAYHRTQRRRSEESNIRSSHHHYSVF